VWQYVTLMKSIYLVDCPGVVYNHTTDTETDTVLKGVVRTEYLTTPEDYIETVLSRVKEEHIKRQYQIASWDSPLDFLEKFATKSGRLLKGGDPDVVTVGKMVLNDWQRGKLPYFATPPTAEEQQQSANGTEPTTSNADKSEAELETDPAKKAIIEKRLEQEAKLKIDTQNFDEMTKSAALAGEEEDEEQGESGSDSDSEDGSEGGGAPIPEEDIIDPNADAEAELAKLDKQLAALKRRDRAMDDSRMAIVEHVKKTTPYMASIEAAYNAGKEAKANKKRNIDLEEEEKRVVKIKKQTAKQRRRDEREARDSKSGNNFYDRVSVKNRKR